MVGTSLMKLSNGKLFLLEKPHESAKAQIVIIIIIGIPTTLIELYAQPKEAVAVRSPRQKSLIVKNFFNSHVKQARCLKSQR